MRITQFSLTIIRMVKWARVLMRRNRSALISVSAYTTIVGIGSDRGGAPTCEPKTAGDEGLRLRLY
jgi:hypothetical protein